jgi:hypothetical protein
MYHRIMIRGHIGKLHEPRLHRPLVIRHDDTLEDIVVSGSINPLFR